MTTTIMTRAVPRTTGAAANPEYPCSGCGTWHSGACPATAHRRLGELLARMVSEADARIPLERHARRTLQEMAPGHDRQLVLPLAYQMPDDDDDACPICQCWTCECGKGSVTRTVAQPQAGIIDDIEREDDAQGYEPEDAALVDVALLSLPTAPALAGWAVTA